MSRKMFSNDQWPLGSYFLVIWLNSFRRVVPATCVFEGSGRVPHSGLGILSYTLGAALHLQYPGIVPKMPQQEKQPEFRTPLSEEPFPNPIFEDQPKNHMLEPFIILAKHKNLILWTVAAAAILSAVISLVLPRSYTANAKILPPQESSSIASAMIGQLGPLFGAAAGKDLGLRNPNDMFVAMLHSRTVSDRLIDRFSLMSVYNKKFRVEAQHKLDS